MTAPEPAPRVVFLTAYRADYTLDLRDEPAPGKLRGQEHAVEIMTSSGIALADLDGDGPTGRGAAQFLLVLTHGAGGSSSSPDLLAVRDAALGLGGLVARITQPYRVKGARAPGSPDRQDAAWLEIEAALGTDAGRARRKPATAALPADVQTVASGDALTVCVVVRDAEPQPARARAVRPAARRDANATPRTSAHRACLG